MAVQDMAALFFAYAWHVIRFPEPCLFTAEEPVVYWQQPHPGSAFMGIGAETTDEVRIVLSPQVALVLTHLRHGFKDRVGTGTRLAAARINYGTLCFGPDCPIVKKPGVVCPLPNGELDRRREWEPLFEDGPVIPA